MDFSYTPKVEQLRHTVSAFMDEHVYPVEAEFEEAIRAADSPWFVPPIMESLKTRAREAGLWNLFLPESE